MQLTFHLDKRVKIVNWKVKEGNSLFPGNVIFEYVECGDNEDEINPNVKCKFKTTDSGVVREILSPKGSCITKGTPLLALDPAEQCTHPIVLHDMCGVCSADLRKLDDQQQGNSASVAMVHSVPGLKVSMQEAQMLGKLDEQHLIKKRKLVLLVDLDQTLIHTTNDNVPANLEDVFHFQLRSHGSVWYHTRLRPGTREFLEKMNNYFQLHICTFGTRQYANYIAHYLDPERKYFSDRILSRDECFSQNSKTANLKELFPRGDHMVCIIDDREDVWNFAPNLIHVKPYHFFRHTGDINAPPGLTKKDNDDKDGFEFPGDIEKAISEEPPPISPIDGDDVVVVGSSEPSDSTKTEDLNEPPTISKDSSTPHDSSGNHQGNSESISPDSNEKDSNSDVKDNNDELQVNSEALVSVNSETPVSVKSEAPVSVNLEAPVPANSEAPVSVKSEAPVSVNLETPVSVDSEAPVSVNSEASVSVESEGPVVVNSEPSVSVPLVSTTSEVVEENSDVKSKETKQAEADSSLKNEKESKEATSSSPVEPDSCSTNGNERVAESEEKADLKIEIVKSEDRTSIKVEDPDDYLMFLEEILKSIHKAYYEVYDDMTSKGKSGVPDVKTVIPYVRRKVLKGTSIVFSGVIPTHIPLEKSRPYAIALSLGAHVSTKIIPPPKPGSAAKPNEPPSTHVVAAREGTAKVNEARKRYRGIHIVTPDWLWSCAERWERVDEKLFLLFKQGSFKRKPPPHCSSPDQYKLGTESEGPTGPGESSTSAEIPGSSAVAGPSKAGPSNVPGARKERTPSGRFMDTINPLLTFSMDEIESMDHEVDDIFNESDSSSSTEGEEKVKKAKKERGNRRKKPRLSPHHVPEPVPAPIQKESSSSSASDDEDEENEIEPEGRVVLGKRKRSPGRTETETEDEPLSARFRRGEPLPSDLDNLFSNSSDDDDNQASNQDDEWMAEALEREFLDENSQE